MDEDAKLIQKWLEAQRKRAPRTERFLAEKRAVTKRKKPQRTAAAILADYDK